MSILSARCTLSLHCVGVRPQTWDLKSIHCHVMQSRDTVWQLSQSEGVTSAIDQSELSCAVRGPLSGRNLSQDVTRTHWLFSSINQRLQELIPELTELMILARAVTLFVCQLNILRYKSLAKLMTPSQCRAQINFRLSILYLRRPLVCQICLISIF